MISAYPCFGFPAFKRKAYLASTPLRSMKSGARFSSHSDTFRVLWLKEGTEVQLWGSPKQLRPCCFSKITVFFFIINQHQHRSFFQQVEQNLKYLVQLSRKPVGPAVCCSGQTNRKNFATAVAQGIEV